MKRWEYYQPNDLDLKDKYGDCTIRALSKAWGCSWIEAFDRMIPICRKYQTPNVFNLSNKDEIKAMSELGFKYYGVSNKKGTKRPTVDEFAKSHTSGTYILNVANHEVACVDGKYYDTWDSGRKSLYGYYEREV